MKSTLVREVVDAVQVRVDRLNQLKHQERLRRQVLFDLRSVDLSDYSVRFCTK